MEAQFLDTGNHLSQLGIIQLAADGGRHQCVYLVYGIALAFFKHIDHAGDEGSVHNGAERTLIYARAALDTLFVIDLCGVVLADGNCLDFASTLTGALAVDNSAVRAYIGALAALHALGFVDMGFVLIIERDRAALAGVLAPMCQAASAGIGDLIADGRTVIAGNVDNLNDIAALTAAHGQLDTFSQDGTLLIYAAAHGWHLAGHDHPGNIKSLLHQSVVPCLASHLPKHFIFQVLNLCVKFMHNCSLKIADLDALAHPLECFRQFLHQIHFDVEIDGQIRVLMSGVNGSAYEKIDISGFLKQHTADEGSSVLAITPILKILVLADIVLGIFHHSVDGNNALCHQIDPFQMRNRGDVAFKIQ